MTDSEDEAETFKSIKTFIEDTIGITHTKSIFTLTIYIDLEKSSNTDIDTILNDFKDLRNIDLCLPYSSCKKEPTLENIYDETKTKIIIHYEKNPFIERVPIQVYNKMIEFFNQYFSNFDFVKYEITKNEKLFNECHFIGIKTRSL